MGKIINVYIMPHAPILIPAIGGERGYEANATAEGCRIVSRLAAGDMPDTIILSSPHAPSYRDFATISRNQTLAGNFAHFGRSEVSMSFKCDLELTDTIIRIANEEKLPVTTHSFGDKIRLGQDSGLDHGALVPLWFLNEAFAEIGRTFNLVHLSTPFLSSQELYDLGRAISKSVVLTGRRAVYIASGDLSHMLTPAAPAGFSPKGAMYDSRLVEIIKDGDINSLLEITPEEMEEAGECGTRSFIMGMGALGSQHLSPSIYSYEGPFGVGYLCAELNSNSRKHAAISKYVSIAKLVIEKYVNDHREIGLKDLRDAGIVGSDESGVQEDIDLHSRAGVFVSLKKHGELRGCIGTISPTCPSIIHEIIQNSVSASSRDPRFNPVRTDELSDLVYSVDILGEAEDIKSLADLDASRYGVIVTRGFRRGLLLPDLDGVDTPQEQIEIALRKAGISPSEDYTIQRFSVTRYH